MEAREKAKELYNKFFECEEKYVRTNDEIECSESAQKCALICVDEILEALKKEDNPLTLDIWIEVKQEIEKL